MASKKLTWSNSKVGYDPGQSQSLTVKFSKRVQKKVTVAFSFSAKSLGQDDYTISQRWNKATIYIYRRNENGKNSDLLKSTYWKYQLHGGSGTSTSKSDTFTFTAKNGETLFNVYYSNERQGTNTPYYGPKSTGDTSTEYGDNKIKIGVLKVDDNDKVTFTYRDGYGNTGIVSNLPDNKTVYRGNSITVSGTTLIDSKNHYIFNGGYTDVKSENEDGVNEVSPDKAFKINATYEMATNKTVHAAWKRQTYVYKFFTDSSCSKEITDLRQSRTYGGEAIIISNCPDSYISTGYSFSSWSSSSGAFAPGSSCKVESDVNFWIGTSANTYTITFNYGYDNIVRTFDYTYGSSFDFKKACLDANGKSAKATTVRPGYKLVGWSYTNPSSVYQPQSTTSNNYNYAYDYEGSVSLRNDQIVLYAVWEYYTTLYLYTDNQWKLVIPYIYNLKSKVWNPGLTYGYIEDSGWKI